MKYNRKIKIAIFSGEIPSTTFIERLIAGLVKKGYVIYLFGVIKKHTNSNSSVHNFGYRNNKFLKAFFLLKYYLLLFFFKRKDKRKLDRLLQQESKKGLLYKVKFYPVLWHRPDIFHIQWAKGLDEWIWVQEFGIKLVLSLRGAHINYSPLFNQQLAENYKKGFPKVNGFHAVSQAISLEAQKYGATQDKIKVIYSGLDLKPLLTSTKNHNSKFHILSIGRPHWIKGYVDALDCCKILKESGIDFHYTIIGGLGNLELHYQINDLELQDFVNLTPKFNFDLVQEKIQMSDLFLLPSLKEGIANVVLEAMALGTIVLTTDCGGMTEVVKNGINGFVCPVRNPIKMAETIDKIFKLTEKELDIIKMNAKKTISLQHSAETMSGGMDKLYQEVMKGEL